MTKETDCPEPKLLSGALMGQVSEAELNRIADHLQDCPACLERARDGHNGDSLIDDIRRQASFRADPELLVVAEQVIQQMSVRGALRGQARTEDQQDETVTSGPMDRSRPDTDRGPDDGTARVTRMVGDYELLSEIARGGMGVVYKARHLKLGRLAAVKMILGSQFASDEQVKRFYTEAEAAAHLDHPGIVPVYEVGQYAGEHFLAMAFIDGESLWHRVKESPLDPREAARLMKEVAEAVHHAHLNGIIHRDLKPQNILITPAGHPRVTDFGLAKRMAKDAGLTATGQLMGTPSYMSPEQAKGSLKELDQRADVYSLGATLYCLLIGRPPFQAATLTETLRQILEQDPVPPRLLNPSIPVDLETICLKCLGKSPDDRYETCQGLVEDLGRFLQGESVSASSLGWSGKLLRAVQHNRDDVHLQNWSVLLALIAAIVFLAEFVIQFLDRNGGVTPFLLTRVVQLVAFAAVGYRFRSEFVTAVHPAVTQMWTLWLGFFAACYVDVVARCEQQWILQPDRRIDYFICYPTFMVLSGFLFVALGRQYWGACYVIGMTFFALAVALPWVMDWSPLLFGVAWGGTLALISWRLRRLRKQTQAESPSV